MRMLIIMFIALLLASCDRPSSDSAQPQENTIATNIENRPKVAEHNKKADIEQYLNNIDDSDTWTQQLADMRGAFELIRARGLSFSQEGAAWKKFLATYEDDIPATIEDQQLRKDAHSNMISANLAYAASLLPEFSTEAKSIVDRVLEQDYGNIEALLLEMRLASLRDAGVRAVLSRVRKLDEQSRSDFYLMAARQYQDIDRETSISFYTNVTDTSKLTILDEPYYQEGVDNLLRTMFQNSVRLARSNYIKANTQIALGLKPTAPTDSEQWVEHFSASFPDTKSVFQPYISGLGGSISVVGDFESVTLYLQPNLVGDRQEITVYRDEQQ